MTSEKKEPKTLDTSVAKGIKANAAEAKNVESSDSLNIFADRLDNLEHRIEELGLAADLQEKLVEYVADLKEETQDIRNYRFWITVFSVVMSTTLFSLLFASMVMKPEWFIELDGKLQVSLITALGGGSIFLMSLLLRGVYRSRHERHQGEMYPEVVKVARETFNEFRNLK